MTLVTHQTDSLNKSNVAELIEVVDGDGEERVREIKGPLPRGGAGEKCEGKKLGSAGSE